MIGFYNYTVILTYLSLCSAVVGITQVFDGNDRIAILCLLISGICDLFDGKVARHKKDRTEQERQKSTAENRKEYQGLPITTSSIILPLIFLAKKNIPDVAYPYVFQGFMTALAILFVVDIKVKKLSAKSIFLMFTLAALVIIGLWKFAPHY